MQINFDKIPKVHLTSNSACPILIRSGQFFWAGRGPGGLGRDQWETTMEIVKTNPGMWPYTPRILDEAVLYLYSETDPEKRFLVTSNRKFLGFFATKEEALDFIRAGVY